MANKTLKGHKLLVLLGVTGPPTILLGAVFKTEWIQELERLFPDLEIEVLRDVTWNTDDFRDQFPDAKWKGVTVLVTGSALPEPRLAPNIQYVQLQSAGANHLLDHPLVKETSTNICTASGVHG